MKLQKQTLRLNMRGEDVAQLQEALRLLGLSISKVGGESHRFGKDTGGAAH